MIKAKFVKAEPTKEGITYVLKGTFDKNALHSAVDLQGEECSIGVPEQKKEETVPHFFLIMKDMIERQLKESYDRGVQDTIRVQKVSEGAQIEFPQNDAVET